MSASQQIAQMLNQLMGPTRNNDVDRAALNYRDNEICKFFLVAFCPHELFTNTKADMGACPYLHDENVRIAYRESRDYERLGYERTFHRFLIKMHDDIRRKIAKNKERLALTQGGNIGVNDKGRMDEALRAQLTAKVEELEREIADRMQEAERCGEMGQLERSQKCVADTEELRVEVGNIKAALDASEQHERLQKLSFVGPPAHLDSSQPKPMEVCETCGCFLIIGDVQQRIDEHFNGKQHMGYARIADTLKSLEERFREMDEDERRNGSVRSRSPEHHSGSVSSRDRYRSPDRGGSSSRHRDTKRDGDGRHRRHHHSHRSGSNSRRSSSKSRSRSRSGDQHAHHRSTNRRERSSSRDREHRRKRGRY